MNISELINQFLLEQSIIRRKETIRYDKDQTDALLKYFNLKSISDTSQFTKLVLLDFIQYQQTVLNVSNTTINKRLVMWQRLIRYGIQNELITENLQFMTILQFKKLRCHSIPKDTLTDEKLSKLLEYIDTLNIRAYSTFRLKLMLLICLSTGVRLTELINIKQEYINISTMSIYLERTKTETPRTLYIDKSIIPLLKLFMQMYPSTYLFCRKDKVQLTADNVTCIFKRISTKLDFNLSPHIIRHTFATKLIKNGIDIESLRKLMGHTSITTTQRYFELSSDYVQAQHQKYSIFSC